MPEPAVVVRTAAPVDLPGSAGGCRAAATTVIRRSSPRHDRTPALGLRPPPPGDGAS